MCRILALKACEFAVREAARDREAREWLMTTGVEWMRLSGVSIPATKKTLPYWKQQLIRKVTE